MQLTDREQLPPPVRTKAAADILGIHPNTLRRWEAEGKITSTRLPSGQRRWDRAKLQELVDNGVQT